MIEMNKHIRKNSVANFTTPPLKNTYKKIRVQHKIEIQNI